MKRLSTVTVIALILALSLVVLVDNILASTHMIISGGQSGKIYFVGPDSFSFGESHGFYESSDAGQSIELRDTTYSYSYGRLLISKGDEVIHRFCENGHFFTLAGLLNWIPINITPPTTYDIGKSVGEIYRLNYTTHRIEGSWNWGRDYTPCSTSGIEYPSWIVNFCSGRAGEIFAMTNNRQIFFSSDSGASFSQISTLEELGIQGVDYQMIHGNLPGQLYLYQTEVPSRLWEVSNYGNEARFIRWFEPHQPFDGMYVDLTTTSQPGELYCLINEVSMCGGGNIYIYHTVDGGDSWQMHSHAVFPHWSSINDDEPVGGKKGMGVYPNPFNPTMTISFSLPVANQVKLTVYDPLGRHVAQLVNGWRVAGTHEVIFDGSNLASGVYVYRLQAGDFSAMGKMALMK